MWNVGTKFAYFSPTGNDFWYRASDWWLSNQCVGFHHGAGRCGAHKRLGPINRAFPCSSYLGAILAPTASWQPHLEFLTVGVLSTGFTTSDTGSDHPHYTFFHTLPSKFIQWTRSMSRWKQLYDFRFSQNPSARSDIAIRINWSS